jgi:hypothetical protein
MVEGSLPLMPSDESVRRTLDAMTEERDRAREIIKVELEKLLHWGAEVSGMTYLDENANARRPCLRPRNMRCSYLQDDTPVNLKRIHWMFHELPDALHRDVLMHRMSHMDVVTNKVMRSLNIVWGAKREGEDLKRSNCIEKIYSRILNEKKTTVVKAIPSKDRRLPFVRHPHTRAQSGNPAAYKPGKTEFYWRSQDEGERVVSFGGPEGDVSNGDTARTKTNRLCRHLYTNRSITGMTKTGTIGTLLPKNGSCSTMKAI